MASTAIFSVMSPLDRLNLTYDLKSFGKISKCWVIPLSKHSSPNLILPT